MFKLDPTTCEECLSLLTDIEIPARSGKKNPDYDFVISKNDATILFSIAKQLSKGIAMTDRQYDLVRNKLSEYKDQFANHGVDVVAISENLMYGIREIDRSHWIKVLTWKDEDVLGIRFPFNKKIINRIEELRKLSPVKDLSFKDNTHYFPYNAQNIFALVEIAKRFDSKFDIQTNILETYNQLKEYDNNREDYIPGVYDNKVKNIPQVAIDKLENDFGKPCDDNILLYYDRRNLYGLHYFNKSQILQAQQKSSDIVNTIVNRNSSAIIFKKESHTFDRMFEGLCDLQRLPLLIILDDKDCHDSLVQTFNSLRHSVRNEDISVMFRNDGVDDPFNFYVKENKLNNLVASNTKVVYINSTKLPKPLLKADWIPNCVINYYGKGLGYNKVTQYAQDFDLQIIYDDRSSLGYWNRTERRYISGIV